MNQEFLDYLNSLSPQEARKIYESISSKAQPMARSYWKKVLDGKTLGTWNDSLAKSLATDINKLGVDKVLTGYNIPDYIYESFQVKDPSKDLRLSPLSRDISKNSPIGKYVKGDPSSFKKDPVKEIIENPVLKPGDIKPGNTKIPTPDEIRDNTVPTEPNRAKAISNKNAPPVKDNVPVVPKNTTTDKSNNGATYKSTKAIYDRPDPNKKALDDLNKQFDPEMAGLMKDLKSSGFKSLQKQADDWEKSYVTQPSSENADRREKINYFLQDFKDTLGPLVDVIDFVEQRRETKQAGRIADESMRNAPTAPTVRGENKMLSNLIRQNQIAYSNPNQMLQPYMDQVNLGYQQDLAQAQELSGGQAGNMAAMGQAAAMRRNQANLEAAPLASKLFQEGITTTGALVGQQMQDDTWRDQQNIDLYKTANTNNQNLQQVAGMGLASSRARKLQARNNMLDSMLTSPAFDVDTYMNYTRNNLINPPTI